MLSLGDKKNKGQISLEFIFSMMVVLVMIYSLIMVLRWSGLDKAERRLAHDTQLTTNIDKSFNRDSAGNGPLKQIDPYFYESMKLKGTVSP